MARISTYPLDGSPNLGDKLIGTDINDLNATKNYTIGQILSVPGSSAYVPYTGATGNVNLGVNDITANSFIKVGGLSTQFLKADGSIDSNTYLTTSAAALTYVPYIGATGDVNLGNNKIIINTGQFYQDANDNLFLGASSINPNGFKNISIGLQAGTGSSANNNVSIGEFVFLNATGFNSVGVGMSSGAGNTRNHCVFIGRDAGNANILAGNTGDKAIGIGYGACFNNQGDNLIAIGYSAGSPNTGSDVVAIGTEAGATNASNNLVAIGNGAAKNNTGNIAVAIGLNAANGNIGSVEAAIGGLACDSNEGFAAIGIGYCGACSNKGDYVIGIGEGSASQNEGDNVVAIGQGAAASGANIGNNVIAIGNGPCSQNSGNHVTAMGESACDLNGGSHVNAFGQNVGISNTHDNVNLFGQNAIATGNNQTIFGGSVHQVGIDYDGVTADRLYAAPDANGVLALSVNGVAAAATGNVELYKEYVALISVSGPVVTATVLKNTLGTTITWTNPSNGLISALAGLPVFTSGKTWMSSGSYNSTGIPYFITAEESALFPGDELLYNVFLHDGTQASTPTINNFSIEIRVYP